MKDVYMFGSNLNGMLYLYNEFNDENVEIELNYESKPSKKILKKMNLMKIIKKG